MVDGRRAFDEGVLYFPWGAKRSAQAVTVGDELLKSALAVLQTVHETTAQVRVPVGVLNVYIAEISGIIPSVPSVNDQR